MRNLAVVLVFLLSLMGVIDTVSASNGFVRVEPAPFSAPVELSEDDGSTPIGNDKKKKKKQDDKDEEDEEDYRSMNGLDRLRMVDPVALDAVLNAGSLPLIR